MKEAETGNVTTNLMSKKSYRYKIKLQLNVLHIENSSNKYVPKVLFGKRNFWIFFLTLLNLIFILSNHEKFAVPY